MSSENRNRDQLGARTSRSGGLKFRLHTYVQRHLYALLASLGQLWRTPIATLMTTLTMAVTLALPAGLVFMVKSADKIAAQWQGVAQISLYLRPGTSADKIDALAHQLEAHNAVTIQAQIPPEQGMQTFTQQLGIAGVLDVLGENPLPHVIVLEVNESHRAPTQLDALVKELTALSNVDLAQLDTEWLKKLNAILAAFERGVWVIAVFLAVAVLLTIGNTINLSIQNRLEEIEVMKLVGAKDAFIRRPFLYGGFWLGVISGLLALILLLSSYLLLSEPLTQVMTLYGGVFEVPADLVFDILGGLMLCAAALGWVGAWIAVARQLHRIEPR